MEKCKTAQHVFEKYHKINWDDITISEVKPNLRHGKHEEAGHVAVARESNQPIKYKFIFLVVINRQEGSGLLAVSALETPVTDHAIYFVRGLVLVLSLSSIFYNWNLDSPYFLGTILILLRLIPFLLPLLFFFIIIFSTCWNLLGSPAIWNGGGEKGEFACCSKSMSGLTYCFCAICLSLGLLHNNSVILPILLLNLCNLPKCA
jgi:hypothetical protein